MFSSVCVCVRSFLRDLIPVMRALKNGKELKSSGNYSNILKEGELEHRLYKETKM